MGAKKYIDEILDYADIRDSKSLEEKWNKDTENMSKEEAEKANCSARTVYRVLK